MQKTLAEIAELTSARFEGDGSISVTGLANLESAQPGDISFLAGDKYMAAAEASQAGAILVPEDFNGSIQGSLLFVADPYTSFVQLVSLFHQTPRQAWEGVHPSAHVSDGAELADDVSVGAGTTIEAGAQVGSGSVLWPGSYVGLGAKVGENCLLHPGVRVLHGVVLGDRVIVHAGTVIGSDGFGYISSAKGHQKIPHIGTVTIGSDVEIGANVTIDRGTLGATKIGNGVKIDNLVHLAHNVIVEDMAMIVAQVGVSGSTKIGAGAVLGGQAGVAGHVEIGPGARIGAQSGVTKSVAPGVSVSGYPATEHRKAKRLLGHYKQLPETARKLKELVQKVDALEKKEKGK